MALLLDIQCGLVVIVDDIVVDEGDLCCVNNIGAGGANGFGSILGAMLQAGSDLTLSTTAGKSGRDSA